MTDHIVSFSIGIDDDAIIDAVMTNAEKQIINSIKKDILDNIFQSRYYSQQSTTVDRYTGVVHLDKNAVLSDRYENLLVETVKEYKDEIIERTANILADSIKRSKRFKEAVGEVIENE